MKHILTIIVSLLTAFGISAQSRSALPWVRTGRSAVDLSVAGSASMSSENMAWAAAGNSAMIPFCDRHFAVEAGYMRQSFSNNSSVNAGLAGNIGGKVGLAASFSYGLDPAYDIYNLDGSTAGTFSPSYLLASLGASWRFVKFLSLGVNARYARQDLMQGYSYGTFAGDAMLMARFGDFSVSAGIANIGLPVKSASGDLFALPTSAKAAFMYDAVFGKKHGIQLNIDGDYYLPGLFVPVQSAHDGSDGSASGTDSSSSAQLSAVQQLAASAGLQYSFADMVFVRAGYHFGGSEVPVPSYASAGLGFKFKGVSLNGAYLFASESLSNSFCLTLGYSF